MKKYFALLSSIALFLGAAPSVQAMDCYVDPVYEYSGNGTISSGVFLRDGACVQGTTILSTLAAGASVRVTGFTDGWYRVEFNGGRGWVGQQFVNTSAGQTGKSWDSYNSYMSELPSVKPGAVTTPTPTPSPAPTTGVIDSALTSRFRGYILLQVQDHGEAWYVNPATDKKYYMKDGPAAYQMMRSFGMGIYDADYAKLAAGNATLLNRFRGRIVLRVQAHGEAYYIHPKTLAVYYLKDGAEAYRIMRLYSSGMANADLAKIPEATIPVK